MRTTLKVIRYLKGSPGNGINVIKGSASGIDLKAYSDADWARWTNSVNFYFVDISILSSFGPKLQEAKRWRVRAVKMSIPQITSDCNGGKVEMLPMVIRVRMRYLNGRLEIPWESQGCFKPSFDKGNETFVVTMPPPNVTGSLHMGHAMFVTLEDIMIRYNRMKGRPTLWLPGTDHAGIATQFTYRLHLNEHYFQLVVERMLASEGIKRTELGREEFTKRVWEWKEKYGGTITNQIRRLGASCDWTREHFTLDEQLSRAVIEAFIKLHEKGLIYQGSYMVNWSPNLQTAVCDLEVEYSEEPGALYHIKYLVAGGSKSDFLTIATTRPETLFGDTAVAVNPEDERYAKYIGKSAIVPMTFGRHVPIIADKYVDKDFGTGVLKISPGHDHNDYLLAKKLGLPILTVMNKDGTLNRSSRLNNTKVNLPSLRKKLWAELEETGLAVKKEAHTSRVPRSQRG
ncbi:valine--tRNA ligase, chloroplastic/mitochondrial 2 isoform X1 [Tanacetum coccineum]